MRRRGEWREGKSEGRQEGREEENEENKGRTILKMIRT